MEQLYLYQETLKDKEKIAEELAALGQNHGLYALKHSFEAEKARYLEVRKLVDKQKHALSGREEHLQGLDRRIEELESTLYSGSVQNPRELTALEAKRDELKAEAERDRRSRQETRDALAGMETQIQDSTRRMKEISRDFETAREEFKQKRDEIQARIQAVDDSLTQIAQDIPPEKMEWFMSQRDGYAGRLLARVIRGDICNCCYRKLQQPLLLRLQNGSTEVRCDHCNRFLISVEE